MRGLVKPSDVPLTYSDMPDVGAILTACRGLESENKPITPEMVFGRLDGEEFYSISDFTLWTQTVQSSAAVFEAVDRIKSTSLTSWIREEIATVTSDEKLGGVEIIERLHAILHRAEKDYRSAENSFVFLKDLTQKLGSVYQDLYDGISYAIPTGFDVLDEALLDGFSKGDLHTIIAFTGHGKSAFALNCARTQAENGKIVGVVSREMSDVENAIRLQTSMEAIPRWQIKKNMFGTTYDHLLGSLDRLGALPIAFDTSTTDIESLRTQVRRMVDEGMEILYVDYLQLMKSTQNARTRTDEVSAVSRGLKEIAMDAKIPVVALCQFNREAKNASVFDLLYHIKETSNIEQDSSTVIYLALEQTQVVKDIKSAQAIVLKNRNGSTMRTIEMEFNGPIFQFSIRSKPEYRDYTSNGNS